MRAHTPGKDRCWCLALVHWAWQPKWHCVGKGQSPTARSHPCSLQLPSPISRRYGDFVVLHDHDHISVCKPSDQADPAYTKLMAFLHARVRTLRKASGTVACLAARQRRELAAKLDGLMECALGCLLQHKLLYLNRSSALCPLLALLMQERADTAAASMDHMEAATM